MDSRFLGLCIKEVRAIVFEYVEKKHISHCFKKKTKWQANIYDFLKRHPEISMRTPEPTSLNRVLGINQEQIAKHRKITTQHPRANGLVENFNRMINKVVKTATIERESPADLLFQKEPYRVRLSEMTNFLTDDDEIQQMDPKQKLKAKEYADRKSHVQESGIKESDSVLLKNDKKGKLVPAYDPIPYVLKVCGSADSGSADDSENLHLYPETSLEDTLAVKDTHEDDNEQIHENIMDDLINEENGGQKGQNSNLMDDRPVRARAPPKWLDDYELGDFERSASNLSSRLKTLI
eukprot:gene4960-5606_t